MQAAITTIALYALKASIALALLYTPYIFFMRRETHFRTNRTTLLLAMLLSLATPFIDIPALHINTPFADNGQEATTFMQTVPLQDTTIITETEEKNTTLLTPEESVYYFLCIPYIIVALIIAAKRGHELYSINRNIRRGTLWHEDRGDYTIYCHATATVPYSWMKSIVISQEDYEKFGKEIILHEEGHILYKHSWDILLLSIVESIQWFNPFVHMLATDLKDIHEFQADAYVLQRENNSKEYQMLIIKKAVGHASYTIANSFNHSKLKKRITMMLKKKSNPVRCATALYILPAAALTLSLFASPQETVGNNLPSENVSTSKSSKTFSQSDIVEQKNHKFVPSDTTEQKIYTVCEKSPEYPGGTEALLKYLRKNTKYPEEALKNGKEGRAYIEFVVNTDGSISNIKVVKSSGDESLDKEAMRVIASMPQWTPGTQGSDKVRVKFTLPVAFFMEKPQSEPSIAKYSTKQINIPKDAKESDIIYEVCEKSPEYPGGMTALMKYLSTNINYPDDALEKKTQGRAHISFVVKSDGSISDIKVAKSSGNESLDKEAMRVIASMPKWRPGTQGGKSVNVRYTLPITFRLA